MKRPLTLILSFTLLLPAFTFPCDCPDPKPLTKENIEKTYQVVFYGKVIGLSNHDGNFYVKFSVIEPYVGKLPKEIEITDPNSDCSLGFGEGQEWLIYARYWKYGKAGTDMCSPSRKYFEKDADDFNISIRGTKLSQDREFLKKNFGVQAFFTRSQEEELLSQRELIKPKGYGMVWLILIGTFCLAIFYTLFNRFFK
jgi:hypothetical protein